VVHFKRLSPPENRAGCLGERSANARPRRHNETIPKRNARLIFILLGGLVAAHLRPPGAAVVAIAAMLALFKGFINGSAMSYAGSGMFSLVGIAVTVFVVVALAAAAATAFTWPPAKIAFRVLGSWTAATGLLLFG
jgi:urease accessory protein